MTASEATAVGEAVPRRRRQRKAWDSDLTACPLCGRAVRRCNMRRHAGGVPCLRRQQRGAGDAGLVEELVERRHARPEAALEPPAPPAGADPSAEDELEDEQPARPLGPTPRRYLDPARRRVEDIPSMLMGRPVKPGTMRSVLSGMTRSVADAPERVGRASSVRSVTDV